MVDRALSILTFSFSALGVMALLPAVGQAQCTPQEAAILTASDGFDSDRLGFAVAVSGDTVVVGAPQEGTGASIPGAAYVYARDHGGPNAWGEVAKLTASDGLSGHSFGISVAISGDTVLVGAYLGDTGGLFSGAAYVFQRDQGGPDTWGEVTKLVALDSAPGDLFGISVALSGDRALVGARNDDDNGVQSGSAYVFERDQGGANAWGQVAKVTAADGAAGDFFGQSVALAGDRAVVGASQASGTGASYVYERDQGGAGSWGEVVKLVAADGAGGDQFGFTVSVSGDTIVVGADFDDDVGGDSGSAYVYERDLGGAGNWGELRKLTAHDAAAGAHFGRVALAGDVVLVGARDAGGEGAIYTFGRDQGGADQWGQMTRTASSNAAVGDQFGYWVALSGGTAVVGGPFCDPQGSESGAAYVFDGVTTQPAPLEESKLVGTDLDIGAHFGSAASLDGSTALIGAWLDRDNGPVSGSAFVFERDHGGVNQWGQVTKVLPSDGSAYDAFGQAVGVSGDTAIISAIGDDENGAFSGSAYIFERDLGGADSWGERTKLTASDAAEDDHFGSSVAIYGDTVLVGAREDDAGSVYVFERDLGGPDSWGERTKFTASDPTGVSWFGRSVSLHMDTAAVCASGPSYLFARDLGGADNWGEATKLTPSAYAFGFSRAISLFEDVLVVGANAGGVSGAGQAYVFHRDQGGPDNWGEVAILEAHDGANADYFGQSVAASADLALVGALGDDDAGNASGSAYVFWRDLGGLDQWREAAKLTANDAIPEALFGAAVAVSGETGIVGAEQDGPIGSLRGSAYVYHPLLAVPPTTYCTAGVSASGCQALIAVSGTPSATAASGFDLIATGVEGGKTGLFFFGPNGRQANPWGTSSSLQCVVPPVKRGALISGGGAGGTCNGVFVYDLNARWTTNPPQNPGAGALVQAQLWYRDPFNTSNQSTSLSDAIEFSVCP